MNPVIDAEHTLQSGDPVSALTLLQEAVRLKPNDVECRIFLFQLYSLLGQWERALNQLEVIARLDDAALAMVQMYRDAVQCEALRAQVFEGKKSPRVLVCLNHGLLLSSKPGYWPVQGRLTNLCNY